jgi:hypothetical protein
MVVPRIHSRRARHQVVTTVFQTLAEKAQEEGIDSKRTADSRTWYRNESAKLKQVNEKKLIDPKNVMTQITYQNMGQMFMFFYNPKHKDTLPYYDRFPLVFPVELYDDGFLGINLHYLPQKLRATLMDALYTTINNKKNDRTTKLRLSYEILKGSSRMRYFKPCLKRYLNGQVLQKFLYIDPDNWDKALMLPTERFVKKTKFEVQRESVRMITGRIV